MSAYECCIKRANSLGIQPRAPQTLFGSFGTLLGLLVARAARVGAAIRVGVRYGLWGDGARVLSADGALILPRDLSSDSETHNVEVLWPRPLWAAGRS